MGLIDAFTAFVYSMFSNGRMGTFFSSDKTEKESYIMRLLDKVSLLLKRNTVSETIDHIFKKSFFLNVMNGLRSFFSELSLNVYGMFAAFYGTAAVAVYFISILVRGSYAGGESALVVGIITLVCSFPLIVSTRSLSEVVADSKIFRRLTLSFFAFPEKKLKGSKRRGGVVYMFFAVGLGLLFGAATYFLHPAYIFVVVALVGVLCIISANPESGVVLTVAMAPFLQYTKYAELILAFMIAATLISYLSKILRHRRAFALSAEGILVLIFCGFIITASIFSPAGEGAFADSIFAAIIIAGGYFTAFSLVRGKRRLSACVKIMGAAFVALSFLGVFSVFYNSVFEGVNYSIRNYVHPVLEGNDLAIADLSSVFSILAVLSVPPIFAAMTKNSSVRKTVALLALLAVQVGACFIYGSFETLVAIAIEFCLFWLLYSHKTFNVIIVLLLPVGIFIAASPFIFMNVDLGAVIDAVVDRLPLPSAMASYLEGVTESAMQLIKDYPLGVGAGDESFVSALGPYLNSVSASAETPVSFYVQLLCWSGIGGAAVFGLIVLLLMKNSLGSLAVNRDREMRADTLALFCSVVVALLFGMVNSIWSDVRILYLFWACVGLLSGYVREERETATLYSSEFCTGADGTDVELIFHK